MLSPRFSARFIVDLDSACFNLKAWANDGFVITLSKTRDYLRGGGQELGYKYIYDAIVGEFDFYRNSDVGDIADDTMSIHTCFKSSCDESEYGAKQVQLPFNTYSRCRRCTWDITVRYDGYFIYYMFGDYTINFQRVDFDKEFNGWAYIGLSGFIRADRYLGLRSAYVCDDIDINKREIRIETNKNGFYTTSTQEITPNQSLKFKYTVYIGSTKVPHMNRDYPEAYNISVKTDGCGEILNLSQLDIYTMEFTITNCSKIGNHYVSVFTGNKEFRQQYEVDVNDWSKMIIKSPLETRGTETYLRGPFEGDFVAASLDAALFFEGHVYTSLIIRLEDNFQNQYIKPV